MTRERWALLLGEWCAILQIEKPPRLEFVYRAAQDNIDKNGSIVADPRSGAAVPNPFLTARDKAFARLESLHKAGVKASVLW